MHCLAIPRSCTLISRHRYTNCYQQASTPQSSMLHTSNLNSHSRRTGLPRPHKRPSNRRPRPLCQLNRLETSKRPKRKHHLVRLLPDLRHRLPRTPQHLPYRMDQIPRRHPRHLSHLRRPRGPRRNRQGNPSRATESRIIWITQTLMVESQFRKNW